MNEGKTTCGRPSRGRYAQGCRCFMCRKANSDYERARSHGAATGRRMVGEAETAEARERVLEWRRRGIGMRTIELWTGVCRSALSTLVSGTHPHSKGLPKRMSRDNYEAIVRCGDIRQAPGALQPSTWALKALDRLRGAGLTYPEIARLSGVTLKTVHSLAYTRPKRCAKATADGLRMAWRKHAGTWHGDGTGSGTLEDWQWAEARHDYEHGVEAPVLAERYGVSVSTVRNHMSGHGCKFGSACALATCGRVAEAKDGFGSRRV